MRPTVTQIVEAKLYDWGDRLQRPDYASSEAARRYRRLIRIIEVGIAPPGTAHGRTSPQELRAVRRYEQMREDAIILRVLKRMTWLDRHVVWLRYVECNRWVYIARVLRRDRSTVYRSRERIIRLFAAAFGLSEN